MSISKKKGKGKKGKRKTASQFGDKTPADFDAEMKAIRKKAAAKIVAVKKKKNKDIAKKKKMKTRSISADIKGRHKEQKWEKAHQKKKAKRFGIDMF